MGCERTDDGVKVLEGAGKVGRLEQGIAQVQVLLGREGWPWRAWTGELGGGGRPWPPGTRAAP